MTSGPIPSAGIAAIVYSRMDTNSDISLLVPFELDSDRRRLVRDGESIFLTARRIDVVTVWFLGP